MKTSKYKGVHWVTRESKWMAKINHQNKVVTLGMFTDERQAALAYDKRAIQFNKPTNILRPKTK